MDDLISRQAAIDKFVKLGDYYDGRDEVKRGIHQCIAATYDLPSAQPDQRWIPCSERLPEDEGEYLVSFDDGFIATTGYYEGDFELWADAGEPLAWMPLPEEYREEK